MSAHFWMGDGRFDTSHENEFGAVIALNLDKSYSRKEEDVHVVFNLKLPVRNVKTNDVSYEDHDMIVLTANKLFDIEMKCHCGRITISQDGEWYSEEEHIQGGCGFRTPFKQVEDHKWHMLDFLRYDIGEFYKAQHPKFDCSKYILGVLLFPNDAQIPQSRDIPREIKKQWFKVINLSELSTLLSRQASGRDTKLSSDEMLTLLTKYFKVKPAELDENGMPYIVKRKNTDELKGIKTASVQIEGGNKNSANHSVTSGQDANSQNGETYKTEMAKGVKPSGPDTKSQTPDRETQSGAEANLNAKSKKSQGEQKDVKASRKPKSANAQGCGCTSSTGQDSSATALRKDYVDYPVTQVQMSSVRIQILGAFLRCFCPEWSPISLASKLFRQKTGIDVKGFVGYDLDTLSRDPIGGKLLKWRRADKYPHKLEVSAIGGKMNEPSSKMVSRVQDVNFLKDVKPEDVDYVRVGKTLRLRPEKVMVAHILKKEV